MKLVVGLGNPGEKYRNTRHSVGFDVVDALALKVGSGEWMMDGKNHNTLYTKHQSLLLAKPQTFMNSSGEVVQKLINFFKVKVPNLWIIHDDLDIKFGLYKIQLGTGPKVHNGLLSIYEKLGTKNFWHVRIGIDNRTSITTNKYQLPINTNSKFKKISGEEYVLQGFTSSEKKVLDETVAKVVNEIVTNLKS